MLPLIRRMLKQSIKDVYFLLNRYLVLPNTWLLGLKYRNARCLRLHLGCGDDYRAGLLNVDGNLSRRKDAWLDLRNPLPFADRSASLIYCSHTLEHLFPEEAIRLLGELRRVLADNGVVRLAVPSFERCLDIAAGRDVSTWPRQFADPRSQAINYLFCDGQHKYAYCFETLAEFARIAGFSSVANKSEAHGLAAKDYGGVMLGDEPKGSLVVELRGT